MAYIELFKALWLYAPHKRGKIFLYILLHTFSFVMKLCVPLVLAQIVNLTQTAGEDYLEQVVNLLGIWVLIFSLDAFTHRAGRVLEFQVSYNAYQNFINHQYQRVTQVPLKWHTNHHSGDTINRINTSAHALREFAEAQFSFIECIIMTIGTILFLGVFSWQASLIVLIGSIFIVFIIHRFDLKLVILYQKLHENRHKVQAAIFDYISNIKTIITLKLGGRTNEVNQRLENGYPIHIQSEGIVNGAKWTSVKFMILALQLMILFHYIWSQHSIGAVILAGNLVAMYQYLDRLHQTYFTVARNLQKLLSWREQYNTATNIFNIKNEPTYKSESSNLKWEKISIKHLNFCYEPHKPQLLDIQLDIPQGIKIAIIGESGSGKSTLLNLLRGLYSPQKVELTVDKNSFNSLEPITPFSTLIPQEPEIFENTILYNLTFGLDFTEEDIQRALDNAQFSQVLKQLDKGIDSDIREKGVNLSGGERQRLALARGLLASQKCSILLLDEPTSSVDSRNESLIYENIFSENHEKTIIASMHRLHLLHHFDLILVMDKGEIVESGTFNELKTTSVHFSHLWKLYLAQQD